MKTGRKISGGKYHKQKKKKLYERKGQPRAAKLGLEKKKVLRVRAGKKKVILLSADR